MPTDPRTLMNFDIPEIRQTYGSRESTFYALSIGIGQDPMNRDQLRFAGGASEVTAVPAMSLVLGHPGFWLADPRTGVDATRLLHGEQGIVVHAPLPSSGTVVGKTRVVGVIDKGAGKGALLYSEKELRDEASGTLLATTKSTTFLRGDGGCGGTGVEPKTVHKVPETDPDFTFDSPTRPEQALYYRWNGDDNPLHVNPDVATKAGFERPILHGLCSLGAASHALLATFCGYDAARFRGLDARFTSVVFPGETLRTEMWRDGSFRTRVVERDVIVIGNGVCRFDS